MADPVKQIYQHVQADQLAELYKYKGPKPLQFNASELAYCKTRLWFKHMNYVPAMEDARSKDYGRDGEEQHDSVRRRLRDAGCKLSGIKFKSDGTVEETTAVVITQAHPDGDFKVSMRLDGFITLGQRKHVLEIKSLGHKKYHPISRVWNETRSEASLLGWLLENRKDMIYQVHACMLGTKVYRTYLLFKDRDSCALGLHSWRGDQEICGGPIVHFVPHVWETVVARIATVIRHLKSGEAPPPEFAATSYECTWCPYNYACHGAERRRKLGMAPDVNHPQLGTKYFVKDL